jgi:hypothetical protein
MPNAANIQTTFSYFNKTRYVHPKQIHLTSEQNIILLQVTYHQVHIIFFSHVKFHIPTYQFLTLERW